jgi:hypothetical protein
MVVQVKIFQLDPSWESKANYIKIGVFLPSAGTALERARKPLNASEQ